MTDLTAGCKYLHIILDICISFREVMSIITTRNYTPDWLSHSGAYSKCPKNSNIKGFDKMAYANSADPDQTAPEGVYTVCHSSKYFQKQLYKKQNLDQTRDPWTTISSLLHICKCHATISSPDKNSYCIFANAMQQHSSSIVTATKTQIWPYPKKVEGHPSPIILTNL